MAEISQNVCIIWKYSNFALNYQYIYLACIHFTCSDIRHLWKMLPSSPLFRSASCILKNTLTTVYSMLDRLHVLYGWLETDRGGDSMYRLVNRNPTISSYASLPQTSSTGKSLVIFFIFNYEYMYTGWTLIKIFLHSNNYTKSTNLHYSHLCFWLCCT